jgi:hypothetical protein
LSDVADVVVFDLADVLAQPTYLGLSKAYGSRSFFMFELIKRRFVFVDSVIACHKNQESRCNQHRLQRCVEADGIHTTY